MFYSKPWLDALIVLAVILLLFGPKRLPALGRSLGHGMREFKDAITGNSKPSDSERAELEAQTGVDGGAHQSQPAPASAGSPASASQPGATGGQTEPATVPSTPGSASSGPESG
jgi:TatA/E family protein of Tat protein translocase